MLNGLNFNSSVLKSYPFDRLDATTHARVINRLKHEICSLDFVATYKRSEKLVCHDFNQIYDRTRESHF